MGLGKNAQTCMIPTVQYTTVLYDSQFSVRVSATHLDNLHCRKCSSTCHDGELDFGGTTSHLIM